MKLLPQLVALFLLTPCLAGAQQTQPAIQPTPWAAPTGTTQRWNGKDLSGWTAFFKGQVVHPTGYWSAVGDAIHLEGKPTGYLRTNAEFSNFHLHTEWRWLGQPAKGTNNSGIFVLQHPPDVVWPYSVQVQVKWGASGDLISQGGLLFPAPGPNPTLKRLADDNEKPAGQWNGDDIYCRGKSIEVFVNGLRQNFVANLPTDSGQIALQMEGYPIEFRNLWVESLQSPSSSPTPP